MKVIIAGTRSFDDYDLLCEKIHEFECHLIFDLKKEEGITEVVSGTNGGFDIERGISIGVDHMGEQWAYQNYVPIKQFPPDWNKHKKAAGPIRNQQMAKYADALLAIWDGKSRGTKNMIDEATKKNLIVRVFNYGETENE